MRKLRLIFLLFVIVCAGTFQIRADEQKTADSLWIAENYDKKEYEILMRDGVKLFTAVYSPKDQSEKYPTLLYRTPYSLNPYGEDQFLARIGPSMLFAREKYIFVYQDVRGRFMSEGDYVNMRMHIDIKKGKKDIDESSDTYD
ncbi:MAG TPA: X-Pro dipeptidyl-peptidase, partial [Flavobacteriales bacterium]|nr:X-Pro dipeptidyl-peptidase [Flavobacteriales bacterium]